MYIIYRLAIFLKNGETNQSYTYNYNTNIDI